MNAISGFGTVLLFLIGGLVFILITLLAGKILRPNKPNPEKLKIYESGEDPAHQALGHFNPRFYVIALIFILFEAELVFLFPWAVVFGDENLIAETNGLWGRFALIETFIFIGILALGLVYVWGQGMLDWVKPKPRNSQFKSKIPNEAYRRYTE